MLVRSELPRCWIVPVALCTLLSYASPTRAADTKGTIDATTLSCKGAPRVDCSGGGLDVSVSSPDTPRFAQRCPHPMLAPAGGTPPPNLRKVPSELVFAISSEDSVRNLPSNNCSRMSFVSPPNWVGSAVWGPTDDELLIADPVIGSILTYTLTNPAIELREAKGEFGSPPSPALRIKNGPRGYIVETDGENLWSLNHRLDQITARLDLSGNREKNGRRVGALYQWLISGNRLFAFSDVVEQDGRWRTGILELNREGDGGFEILFELPFDDPLVSYYYIGLDYLAEAGGRVYLLLMEKPRPSILQLSPERKRLDILPEKFKRVPQLPAITGSSSYPIVYDVIANSTMPVGLYGFGKYLILLSRSADDNATTWYLTRIALDVLKVDWTVRLPSRAPHLSVVPGESTWAFIEKGQVEALGTQDVLGTVLIPTAELRKEKVTGNELCGKSIEMPASTGSVG